MPQPLPAVIRKLKCEKLKRQIQGSENIAKYAIIRGENAKLATSKDPAVFAEIELKNIYYSMLDRYNSKSTFSLPSNSKSSSAFWKRVVARKEQAGVSAEEFIRAQFIYFQETFKSPPTLPCLVTSAAVERAMKSNKALGNVISGNTELKADKIEILKYYDDMIRKIMKVQKLSSKEEFYTKFVITGSYPVSPVYLDNCPIWKKIKK